MNISGSKILVLPYSHTLSHLSRPLEISKQLKINGCEIIFGGSKSKAHFIQNEHFQFQEIFEPDPGILYSRIRNKKIRFVDDDTLNKMIVSDLNLFHKVKPDLVLSDGRFSAMVSTQIAGIKHAAIVNASSTAYRAIPYFPFIKRPVFDCYPCNNFLVNICNSFNLKFEMFMFDNIMNIFKKLSKKHNLDYTVTATNCLCGTDLTLIADNPEYFPTKKLPSNYQYIGPVTWKAHKSLENPQWWPVKKNGAKLIYITMGTTGEEGLFQKIYDFFKSKKDTICIITTGEQTDQIKPIPGQIYVTAFMDGDTIMKNADLVICHGGNGTIYQALSFGKPVIGIPVIPDQDFNMRMVENLGVGKKLTTKEILSDSSILEKQFDIINDPLVKSSLSRFKKKLDQKDGAVSGAKILLDFIENNL